MQKWTVTMRTHKALRTSLLTALSSLVLLTAVHAAGYPGGDPHNGAYLGVHVNDMSPEQAVSLKVKSNTGALVLSIDQDGPACKAGLKANDVIVAVNGKKVEGTDQLANMMRDMPGGKAATVTVIRGGQSQDIKVVLGSRHDWMESPRMPVANTFMAAGPMAPMPPVAYPPDVDMTLYTPTSARQGLTVESLSPQLAEYFGAPRGQGVLVRGVQKASPAANAGIRAGDVIVKVNGEVIRDLADWKRTMRGLSGKTTFSVMRDKREQALEVNVPGPASGLVKPQDWEESLPDMNALSEQMQLWGPELQRQSDAIQQSFLMDPDEMGKMQRDIDKSMKQQSKEIKRQAKEIQKQAEALRKEMEKMAPQLTRQAMEIEKSVMPTPQDVDAMTRLANDQMKVEIPKIQQKMEEFRKKVDQRSRELEEQMKKQSEQQNQF